MSQIFLKDTDEGCVISLHIQPGAAHSAVAGVHGDRLKLRIHAPAVEGKANEELLRFLCGALKLPRQQLEILSGQKSRGKKVLTRGLTAQVVAERLGL